MKSAGKALTQITYLNNFIKGFWFNFSLIGKTD